MNRDDKPLLIARDCYILTNSGALWRMQLSVDVDGQTDRQTTSSLNTSSHYVARGLIIVVLDRIL